MDFIEGIVIYVVRPEDSEMQKVFYKGQMDRNSLKYQAINNLGGLIIHAYGPMEGRRDDWTLYVRSSMEEHLGVVMDVN